MKLNWNIADNTDHVLNHHEGQHMRLNTAESTLFQQAVGVMDSMTSVLNEEH